MDKTGKETLAILLQLAVKNIQIHDSPTTDRPKRIISNSSYRALYLSNTYNPNILLTRTLYAPYVQDRIVESQLLDVVRSELRQFVYQDRISYGTTGILGGLPSYPLDKFLGEILRIAVVGVGSAVSFFEKCLSQNYIDFQEMTLLDGIRIDRELQIADGVKFISLPRSTEELPDILPPLISGSSIPTSDFLGKTVAVLDFSIFPRFQKLQDSSSASWDGFQRKFQGPGSSKFDLEKFLQYLSLASNSSITRVLAWSHVDKMEPFARLAGFTHWGYMRFHQHSASISESDISVAKELYHKCTGLGLDVQEKLNIAIPRWVKSKHEAHVDRIIDLGIAFEVLYLDGPLEQLSYMFRLRASWHLGNSPSERKELMQLFSTIYELRSKAVHKGKLPADEKTRKILSEAEKLCARAIVKFINDGGCPDWGSLVTGGS